MASQTRQLGIFALLAATALGVAACGGSNTGDMGQMKLAVTDQPARRGPTRGEQI